MPVSVGPLLSPAATGVADQLPTTAGAVVIGVLITVGLAKMLDSHWWTLAGVDRWYVALGATTTFTGVAVAQYGVARITSGDIVAVAATAAVVLGIGFVVGTRGATTSQGALYGLLTGGFGGVLSVVIVALEGLFLRSPSEPQYTGIVLLSGVILPTLFGTVGGLAGALGGRIAGGTTDTVDVDDRDAGPVTRDDRTKP